MEKNTKDKYKKLAKAGVFASRENMQHVQCSTDKQFGVIKYTKIDDKMTTKEMPQLYTEARVLLGIAHPNIIRVRDVFKQKAQGAGAKGYEIGMTYDFITGKTMEQKFEELAGNGMPEKDIVPLFVQMCLAIEEVHINDVMHKKFTPCHIMVTDADQIVKVIGFSSLHEMNHEGSIQFDEEDKVAPFEVIDGKGKTQAADVWALGLMLYQMCTGTYPFKDLTQVEDNKKFITSGAFLEEKGIADKSDLIKNVLKGALTETPDARMSIMQIRALLKNECEELFANEAYITAFKVSAMRRLLLDEKYELQKLQVSDDQAAERFEEYKARLFK